MPFTIKRYKTKAKWNKYKSCVGKVEKKGTAVNPHAVCRKSVYGTKKQPKWLIKARKKGYTGMTYYDAKEGGFLN